MTSYRLKQGRLIFVTRVTNINRPWLKPQILEFPTAVDRKQIPHSL